MAISIDDQLVRKAIYGRWFAGKRYFDLLAVSNKSEPLSFTERLVYSFVIWLARQKAEEGKPLSVIAHRLHLGRTQVAQAAKELEIRGLVVRSRGRKNAALLLPTGEKLDQYFVVKAGRPSSNRLYLLNDNSTITMRDAALLSVLYSIAAARGTTFLKNRKKGLARLASISRSQVDVSLKRLKEAGAVVFGANHLALKRPPAEFLANFQDTGKHKATVEPGRLFSVEANSPDNEKFAQEINDLIAKWQEEQLAAGWAAEDCNGYWRTTLFDDGLSPTAWKNFLLLRYPALWITAQEQHVETGQAKTCRHLLTSLSKHSIENLIEEMKL